MDVEYLPTAVKTLRERRDLRIEDLAVRAHVSPRQLRYIEQGAIPRADTLARLATALRVSIQAFFAKRSQ
jgi:transcriptional regulator with XRE-family HTH domain